MDAPAGEARGQGGGHAGASAAQGRDADANAHANSRAERERGPELLDEHLQQQQQQQLQQQQQQGEAWQDLPVRDHPSPPQTITAMMSRRRRRTRFRTNDRASNLLRSQFERIPARDHVFLSTWEKWRLYGRFPWKLILHIALLVLTTWQIVNINARDAAYVRAARRNFYYYFFPADFDFDERRFFLYTVDEARDSVLRATTNFKRITTTSVDQISHPIDSAFCLSPGHCSDGHLEIIRFADESDQAKAQDQVQTGEDGLTGLADSFFRKKLQRTTTESFFINENDLGPFAKRLENRLPKYLRSVLQMELVFRLQARGPTGSGRECLVWEVRLFYNFQQRGQMILTLQSEIAFNCAPPPTAASLIRQSVHVVDILVVMLSCWTLALCARSVWLSWRLLRRAEHSIASEASASAARRSDLIVASMLRDPDTGSGNESFDTPLLAAEFSVMLNATSNDGTGAATNEARAFQDNFVPDLARGKLRFAWRDRLRFFNFWFVLASLAAVLNSGQAIARLVRSNGLAPVSTGEKFAAGLGCGLIWVNSVSFLAHKPQYLTIVLTLNRALPRVARFLMGVVPILLAYALFGMIFFGDHAERFGSFGMSMITLFSVLNGDVIRETFMDIVSAYPVMTQIYLYTFISLFMYVVLNVFIAIVEESFFSTRAVARSLETFAKQVRDEQIVDDGLAGTTIASSLEQGQGQDQAQRDHVGRGDATLNGAARNSPSVRRGQGEEDGEDVVEQRRLRWLHHVLDSIDD